MDVTRSSRFPTTTPEPRSTAPSAERRTAYPERRSRLLDPARTRPKLGQGKLHLGQQLRIIGIGVLLRRRLLENDQVDVVALKLAGYLGSQPQLIAQAQVAIEQHGDVDVASRSGLAAGLRPEAIDSEHPRISGETGGRPFQLVAHRRGS